LRRSAPIGTRNSRIVHFTGENAEGLPVKGEMVAIGTEGMAGGWCLLGGPDERGREVIGAALAHADRRMPAQWYLRGLMLPGGRKSVEPMAARVQHQNVRSAHQSM